jgi:hypothetical protein
LEQETVLRDHDKASEPLADLAVLVLFSVFEAQVRQHVFKQVEEEAGGLRHLSLQHAAQETLQRIGEGSFFRVLEPFKGIDPDLVEQVNQVRRYRNWVAHGRQGERGAAITPDSAFERLGLFLDAIGLTGGASISP